MAATRLHVRPSRPSHQRPGARYRDTSPIRRRPPPQDPPRTLGIGLLQGPTGGLFLMGEVPLYVVLAIKSEQGFPLFPPPLLHRSKSLQPHYLLMSEVPPLYTHIHTGLCARTLSPHTLTHLSTLHVHSPTCLSRDCPHVLHLTLLLGLTPVCRWVWRPGWSRGYLGPTACVKSSQLLLQGAFPRHSMLML